MNVHWHTISPIYGSNCIFGISLIVYDTKILSKKTEAYNSHNLTALQAKPNINYEPSVVHQDSRSFKRNNKTVSGDVIPGWYRKPMNINESRHRGGLWRKARACERSAQLQRGPFWLQGVLVKLNYIEKQKSLIVTDNTPLQEFTCPL